MKTVTEDVGYSAMCVPEPTESMQEMKTWMKENAQMMKLWQLSEPPNMNVELTHEGQLWLSRVDNTL